MQVTRERRDACLELGMGDWAKERGQSSKSESTSLQSRNVKHNSLKMPQTEAQFT
jgi:hypothetical protein